MSNSISYAKKQETSDYFKIISNLYLDLETKREVKKMIEDIENDVCKGALKKGLLLEELVVKILEKTKIFECVHNGHTTSNEIDILVKLNLNGRVLRKDGIIPEWIPNTFLIECKNYSDKVKVDYIGKFYSLLDVSNVSLGVFISRKGISGCETRYWEDATAFLKKINLKYSLFLGQLDKQRILLDLSLNDLKKILENETSIIDIIENRQTEIKTDLAKGLTEWIKPHENEGKIRLE